MQQVAHEPNHEQGLRVSKHIFVGNSRLVTALTHQAGIDTTEQAAKLYYYHADHLQSAQFITNAKGEQYEHIEYTPYGELWIEEVAAGLDKLPFRFTGKELDTETGLYYYGARYLDPKYSRWLSGDPALAEYIPQVGADTSKLPNNGVYNTTNLQVFNYGNNNPIKYNDPDGRLAKEATIKVILTDIATPEPTDAVLWKWVGYGVVIAGAVVIDYFVAKTVSKASAKAKEQAKAVAIAEKGNRSFGSIIIQIQEGRKSVQPGSERLACDEKGVRKSQAQDALREQVDILSNIQGYGKMTKSKAFQDAVIQMSKNIENKNTYGEGDQPQMRVIFKYNGQNYRIDMQSHGNKPNLIE